MSKSNQIHEFDPLIYPTRIWVGTRVPKDVIVERFYSLLSDGSVSDFEYSNDVSSVATCYPVGEKESGWKGILCIIHKPKNTGVGVIAHEAEHIVCWICEQFGIESTTFEDSEPRAYLIQWVANSIYEAMKNK